jgi:O-methyltransferase involved in polyketide biosynthesis
MIDTTIQSVPDTAFMAAAYRAIESERTYALFRDPLADKLAGERGRAIIASLPPQAMMGGWSPASSTNSYSRPSPKAWIPS